MENETNKNNKTFTPKMDVGAKGSGSGNIGRKIAILTLAFAVFMSSGIILYDYLNHADDGDGPVVIGGGRDGVVGDKNASIKKFASADELRDFLDKGLARGAYGGFSSARNKIMTNGSVVGDSNTTWSEIAPSGDTALNNPASSDFSTTNIQVAGVDEADIVKTDGRYIYTISNNTVSIINAYPAEGAEIVSKIELDAPAQSMYLNKDRLAVYGQNWNFEKEKAMNDMILPTGRTSFTYLKIYDIEDRKNPKEVRSLYFEGSSADSRLIGDYIYLVTSTFPYYAYMGAREGGDAIAPIVIDQGVVLNAGGKEISCKGCSNVYYFDMPYNSYAFTTVSSININDASEKVKSEVFLLDQSQNNIYVSENNLYITFTKQINEEVLTMDITMDMLREYVYPKMSASDREMVEEIEKTKNYILSPEEKLMKIGLILEKYEKEFQDREDELEQELEKRIKQRYEDISKELEKTVIHKIAINKGELKYETSGEVTGMVLNQFSMDENSGYFRIATTKNRTWSRFSSENLESYSNIYVLDQNMKVIGKAENIAKGEQIYSVRFMQNRAYMVTFERVDPLFVIDLKDPADPKILGELKVPGFSSYLHPYDDTTLIGLGKESDENGRVTGGVKLSLFDVSDVENPKELDKYVIGDSSSNSIAINEHKAFLFSRDKNLLVIPVSTQEVTPFMKEGISFEEQQRMIPEITIPPDSPVPPAYPKYFNGAYVFSIDKFRFNLRGKIDHADDANGYWKGYNVGVQRGLYIKDILYTVSSKYLKANKIEDLAEVKTLELPGGTNNYAVPMTK